MTGWMDRAACRPDPSWSDEERQVHVRLFFPERGDSRKEAKKFCARCPVQRQCHAYAEANNEENGIWAGETRTRPQPEKPQPEDNEGVFVIPKRLSATSVNTYMACPARWRAEYMNSAKMPSGSAASLGTVCHSCAETWVTDEHYLKIDDLFNAKATMRGIYDQHYWQVFGDADRYDEGLNLVLNWVERTDFSDREVLAVEEWMTFKVPTSAGEIEFVFIMDRLDRLSSGMLEIIDYKTLSTPMPPSELKHMPQPRLYALGVQLMYPEVERIWMTFDMLRYEPIGIVFTKEENRATWKWLCDIAERIVQDNEAEERLNDSCRWCVRKDECKALKAHMSASGPLGIINVEEAVTKYFEIDRAIKALTVQKSELEPVIALHMEQRDIVEATIAGHEVKVTMSSRRDIDDMRVRQIVGDELMGKYGTLTMAKFDAMLKDSDLSDDQRMRLKTLVTRKFGDPKIVVNDPAKRVS